MAANSVMTHRNVGVLTIAAVEAPEVVTSAWIDEQLSETYARNGLSAGILADLAGIEARRWWPEGVSFEQAAARAGRVALDESGIDPNAVGMLISTSVCKHHLEPSVADGFVKCITSHSDVVLFSAAIPFQGGTHHVNLQWQDYWAGLFEKGATGTAV